MKRAPGRWQIAGLIALLLAAGCGQQERRPPTPVPPPPGTAAPAASEARAPETRAAETRAAEVRASEARTPEVRAQMERRPAPRIAAPQAAPAPLPLRPAPAAAAEARREDTLVTGTGVFVRSRRPAPGGVSETAEGVALNFVDTELNIVVAAVLGDLLGVNYVIDPAVGGIVTVQTGRPLAHEDLLPTLETVLNLHGAVLIEDQGFYRVAPLAAARRSGVPVSAIPRRLPESSGYGVHVVPLSFVPAPEMAKILEPIAPDGSILHVDALRNLLVLAASEPEMESLLEAIDIFDVDWLAGMSFGLFPLDFAGAAAISEQLTTLFGDPARGGEGVVRFVPIEHLNAILVITPQAAYLERVKSWIERLDQGGGEGDRRVYVYRVQHGRAANLAESLTQIFVGEGGRRERESLQPVLAPGLTPVEIASPPAPAGEAGGATTATATAITPSAAPPPPALSRDNGGQGVQLIGEQGIRIISDEERNSLIILATPKQYETIEATLRKLDVPLLQVLIQAQLAEVRLTEDLSYGVRWFFERGKHTLSIDNLPAAAGAFSYAFSSANFAAALEALAGITELNIISAPELMVLDNQTAVLQVGDSVPVATRSAVGIDDPDAPIVNTISFRDTGVILNVTPRVNAGGVVTLDIRQEVSDVTPTDEPTVTPTIFQRSISSTVAVQDGESVALGGLISETMTDGRSGVPILMDIPVLGNLFRSTSKESRRTELLVLITPRVVRDTGEARRVTGELRNRMARVHRLLQERQIRPAVSAAPPRAEVPPPEAAAPAPQPAPRESVAAVAVSPEIAIRPAAEAVAEETPRPAAPPRARPAVPPEPLPSEARPEIPSDQTAALPERGLYGLHVASYKSLEEAEREWRVLQSRYPVILGTMEPIVQKVDLGSRGTYYRVAAGTLDSQVVADALCARLEARGQYCRVAPLSGGS